MRRQLLLLAGAALLGGAGCGRSDCTAESLRVYWTPASTGPTAGFTVPGLVAAGLPAYLDCHASGLDLPGARVEVRVNDVTVSCRSPDPCVGTDWACTTGGVDVVGYPLQGGGNKVEIFGYSDVPSTASMTYYGRLDQPPGCNMTTVGVVSGGLDGTLGLDYVFTPAANCTSGTKIYWDLRQGTVLGPTFDAAGLSTGIACGTANPFNVYGGGLVPAGVYTLATVAERSGTTSYHAYCSSTPFAHAGNEVLSLSMPLSTGACF